MKKQETNQGKMKKRKLPTKAEPPGSPGWKQAFMDCWYSQLVVSCGAFDWGFWEEI